MTVFPILNLPHLAIEEVFKQLRFEDIYSLSKCSKKSTDMIRLVNTRKYTLDIRPMAFSLSFFLNVENFHWTIPKNEQKQSSGDPNRNFEELRAEFSDLLTTFKFHQKSCVCAGTWTPEQNQLLLETIIRKQGNTFENFVLSENYGEISNQWILENIKVNSTLTTYGSFAQKGFIFKSCPKVFQSYGSSWITLDTLVSMGSCKAIEVSRNVLLTTTEINSFMEMWKKDMFPNLEYLCLRNTKWKYNETILGFTHEQLSVKRDEKRRKKIECVTYDCDGGVDIQSNGGVNGRLHFEAVFKTVSFFVWKD